MKKYIAVKQIDGITWLYRLWCYDKPNLLTYARLEVKSKKALVQLKGREAIFTFFNEFNPTIIKERRKHIEYTEKDLLRILEEYIQCEIFNQKEVQLNLFENEQK